ncbi:F0F1 ATP synthase subunit B [Marinobacter halodurans]|uniref:ATP synthase subunit b n=1 Tax=Marinobacter halodurans TaxID=2528979 RepID=A0ABY1ZK41_9GAMM|nr:F0F1 ATP synthase subunit B [Marinobacter halodurans]TBW55489.1 F0F1 ATP synthase subunit B [Marinobacter halodurans]
MSIDWITVIAQIANFLVLVWLLKRFLYKPILNGIDARETEIARRMGEAGAAREEAEAAEKSFHARMAQLQADRDAAVAKALKATEEERAALLAETHTRLAREQRELHVHMEQERQKFLARLQQAGAQTLVALTRKALRELADETLEAAMVRQVLGQLAARADELAQAAGSDTTALVTTRAPLPEDLQAQLHRETDRHLPGFDLRFATNAVQSPGLILQVGGAQLSWTVDSYTDELTTLLDERLAAEASGRGDTPHAG